MMFHTQIVCVARSLVRAARACLLLLLLAMPVASFAASPALSLEEATRLAVERAPMLNARRSQIEAAEQESRRAGALPDPMLTVGIDNLPVRSEEHTSELQSLMRISYAVFCLKKQKTEA